ncbi:hypothetical protein AVEN_229351-1 [Araneus ventricosus]|uniref:Uncharacterized protein n=1 Tax=Araneus ventricosus TaxID=182803 RepID=A0A4Y2I2D7_ARAVE|nr:hypothetical protein AVEN_229351-1 [Araneus ventricosus]
MLRKDVCSICVGLMEISAVPGPATVCITPMLGKNLNSMRVVITLSIFKPPSSSWPRLITNNLIAVL